MKCVADVETKTAFFGVPKIRHALLNIFFGKAEMGGCNVRSHSDFESQPLSMEIQQ